jgi:hypothetical protein
MVQRHDQGWKKQQATAMSEPLLDTEHLARELVENGLCSPRILESRFSRSKETNA